MDLAYFALLIFAYLTGSISTAVIVCRIFTLPDPRIVGSHNPGATNVLRIGGKRAAIATLLGDMFKTALPILIAIFIDYEPNQLAWIGVFAMLGHCFPVYFNFKGGKGVASMMAVIALSLPRFFFLALGVWLIVLFISKRSSVASMTTALVVPPFVYHFANLCFLPFMALSLVVMLRHRSNIINIAKGTEPIVGHKA
ncbi:MAG: glycerol-3-phosphate 1-O-acyltransferase PlsY [Gammaproteobacteria bacterium]|nr:glycerol-3-phosphate 1-O-acyltransferase PlsY [Gammaproteobacteria bacterium]MDH5628626.1 glycerol-3-phosphate 1-O-acyltransferase PlsY [Gammaproteobacteria bacterium]